MTTITSVRPIDQGAIAKLAENFQGNELDALGQMFQKDLEALTSLYLKCVETAYQIKTKFEVAAASDDVKIRKKGREDKKYLLEKYGWPANIFSVFGKFGESLIEIEPYNLQLLDIKTLEALCKSKFTSVIDRLRAERLTVVEVREEMAEINKKLKKPKEPEKVVYWKQTKWGDEGNAVLIVQLQDRETGLEFEKQFEESEKVSVVGFIKELLSRPTIEEKIKAQFGSAHCKLAGTEVISAEIFQEQFGSAHCKPETFTTPAFFESPVFSDEAEKELIDTLLDRYQKIDTAIERLLLEGYEETSYPMSTARKQLADVILELRSLGAEAELAETENFS